MKKYFLILGLAVLTAGSFSCKGKDKADDTTTSTSTTVDSTPTATTPVVVSGDDELRKGVDDAAKDIKGLKARVDDGVIYLSGTISRDDNMRVTPTLNSLHPKRIVRDSLTVK